MAYRQRQPEEYDDLDEVEEKRKRKLKNDELAPDDEVELASLAAEDLGEAREPGYRRTPIMTRDELRERLAEARRDMPLPRAGGPQPGAAIVAAGLIAAGAALLLINAVLGLDLFRNWWAIFILVPGARLAFNAYHDYRAHGRLTRAGKRALGGGAFVLLTGLLALTGAWQLWPLYVALVVALSALGIYDEGNGNRRVL